MKLETKQEAILAALRPATGPGNRGPLHRESKSIRNAAPKAIIESIENILRVDPNPGTRLRHCIHIDGLFSYEPEKDVSWGA